MRITSTKGRMRCYPYGVPQKTKGNYLEILLYGSPLEYDIEISDAHGTILFGFSGFLECLDARTGQGKQWRL